MVVPMAVIMSMVMLMRRLFFFCVRVVMIMVVRAFVGMGVHGVSLALILKMKYPLLLNWRQRVFQL